MIWGLVQILFFQGLGEIVSHLLLPRLPGPVIGLVLLLGFLVLRRRVDDSLALVADGFGRYLGLLFVPAAVGVVLFLPQLRQQAAAIVCALVASSALTIAASALALRLLGGKEAADG